MWALGAYLRVTAKRRLSTPQYARKRMATVEKTSPPPEAVQQRHDVPTRDVGGFACHTVAPRGLGAQRAVIYLHGGAHISSCRPSTGPWSPGWPMPASE